MGEYISEVHRHCEQNFVQLLNNCEPKSYQEVSEAVQTEFSRYKVWATNVGAGHSGKAYERSLDYRFRKAPVYKEHILRLLKRISEILLKCVTSLQNFGRAKDDGASEKSAEDDDDHTSDEDDLPNWSRSGSETSTSAKLAQSNEAFASQPWRAAGESGHTTSKSLEGEITEFLNSLRLTVTCLYKIPIRNAAPLSQQDLISGKTDVLYLAYREFDRRFVRDLYPLAAEWLISRLALTITRRRQALTSRRARNERLKSDRVQSSVAQDQIQPPKAVPTSASSRLSSVGSQRIYDSLSLPQSSLKASTFKPTAAVPNFDSLGYDTISEIETASVVSSTPSGNGILPVPPRPKNGDGQDLTDFECPYCCIAIHVRLSHHAWKKHVLKDLQPYQCTHYGCTQPDEIYTNRHDWSSHEASHRVVYQCMDLEHDSLVGIEDFRNHMALQHDFETQGISDTQFEMFRAKSTENQPKECPLCREETSHIPSHLGRHLERIALFALPRSQSMDNDHGGCSQAGSDMPVEGSHTNTSQKEDLEQNSISSFSSEIAMFDREAQLGGVPETDELNTTWNFIDDFSGHQLSVNGAHLLVACPYNKHDPIRFSSQNTAENYYRTCDESIASIANLKQHLKEVHRAPTSYCPQCSEVFENFTTLSTHLKESATCSAASEAYSEKMTEMKWDRICVLVRSNKHMETVWYDIFKILFPGSSLPESLYVPHTDPILKALATVQLQQETLGSNQVEGGENLEQEEQPSARDAASSYLLVSDKNNQKHRELSLIRVPGIGNWLLESSQYKDWINGRINTILCHGFPGSGKTFLASLVIDDLLERYRGEQDIGVAYFYYDSTNQDHRRNSNVIRCIVDQQLPSITHSEAMAELYHFPRTINNLHTEEAETTLRKLISVRHKLFIIIDALDACPVESIELHRALIRLAEASSRDVRFELHYLATSRYFDSSFQMVQQLEITTNTNEARRYIAARFDAENVFQSNALLIESCQDIKDMITEESTGLFTFIECCLASVAACKKAEQLHDLLKARFQHKAVYELLFQKLCHGFTDQTDQRHDDSVTLLTWILFAKRPLTFPELQAAMPGFDKVPSSNLLQLCSGFVVPSSNRPDTFCIAHKVIESAMRHSWMQHFPEAKERIARRCVTYLKNSNASRRLTTFSSYAAQFWGEHARGTSIEVDAMTFTFLINREDVLQSAREMDNEQISDLIIKGLMNGFSLAAWFGLANFVGGILQQPPFAFTLPERTLAAKKFPILDPHTNEEAVALSDRIQKNSGECIALALFIAAAKRHKRVLEVILDQSVIDWSAFGPVVRQLLQQAAAEGNAYMIRLIRSRTNVRITTNDLALALMKAIRKQDLPATKELLSWKALDPNLTLDVFLPLTLAISLGDIGIVKALWNHPKIDLNLGDYYGMTPLQTAVEYNEVEILRLLLSQSKVRVNEGSPSAFSNALSKGDAQLVQTFLNYENLSISQAEEIILSEKKWFWDCCKCKKRMLQWGYPRCLKCERLRCWKCFKGQESL